MKEQVQSRKNTVFLSILRIIAAIFVVAGHTKALTNDTTDGYIFFHVSILWCVPIFFMITGYIFLGIKKEVTYSGVRKNIVKFLVTLLTIGWFCALLERFFDMRTISVELFLYSLFDVFSGNLWAHMWYVYAAIGVYLILPVLSAFVKKNKQNLYILTAVCFLFNIVLNEVSTVCEVGFRFPLTDFCFYVLAGAVMFELEEEKLKKMFLPSILFLIVALIVMALRVYVFHVKTIPLTNGICVAAMVLCVFIISQNIFRKTKSAAWIDSVAKCTWGIYLIHPFYINLLGKLFDVSFAKYNQFIAFPIAILLIFAVSYGTVLVLKKIPLVKEIF